MATALDLLMSTKEDVNLLSEESDICTIDAKTRVIFVPSTIVVGGVQSDKNAERIKFSCPKIVGDNLDLSKFSVRINFENVSSVDFNVSIKDQYICDDVAVDGENVTFSWLIGRNAARYMGTVRFIVCAVKTDSDSNISVEWNTAIAEVPVLEGIEIDQPQIGQEEKDVINQLLELTKNTSAEAIQNVNSAKEQAIKDIQSVSQPDTTLTIEGGLAEAKATGEAIGSLKEDTADINSRFSRYNLFDKDTASIVNIMCNSSLVFVAPSDGVQSTIWKCEPNTTYTISWTGISGNNRYIIYSSKEMPIVNGLSKALRKINMSNTVSGSSRHYTTITTTSEENYLLLYFWMYESGGDATLDTMQISTGNRLLDYVPYSDYEMPNLKLMQHQFDGITIDVTNCTDEMANLLGCRNLGALDKGYICLVADDGYAKVSNVTFPIAKEKNIPITLALWTDSEVVTNPTLLAELRTMIANNNIGICQHGAGHFTDYSPKGLYNYLISEKDKWVNLSLNVAGVAYPNHSRNEQVRTICGALYGVCCSGGSTRPMVYLHDTNGARSNIFDLYRISLYSKTESYLKDACDFANSNKKLVIIFWHDSDIYGDDDQINKLKNVIDYAKTIGLTFVNVGDIPLIN